MTKCCEAITHETLDGLKALPHLPSSAFPSIYIEKWLKEIFTSKFDFSQIELRKPNIPLDESTTIEIGGRQIELLYFGPGHTEGDMVAYIPDSKVLFAGDLLFLKGSLPLVC
jgi:glyoxylase-like metal-dependent hydrolase (beta-lactamase superfamily II)